MSRYVDMLEGRISREEYYHFEWWPRNGKRWSEEEIQVVDDHIQSCGIEDVRSDLSGHALLLCWTCGLERSEKACYAKLRQRLDGLDKENNG
jgi:hypothetical protein